MRSEVLLVLLDGDVAELQVAEGVDSIDFESVETTEAVSVVELAPDFDDYDRSLSLVSSHSLNRKYRKIHTRGIQETHIDDRGVNCEQRRERLAFDFEFG